MCETRRRSSFRRQPCAASRRVFHNDPDGLRLPVKLDTATNGEFAPIPLESMHRLANETAMREATRHARGLGLSRREFLVSAAGTATTLLAMNAAYAAAGNVGGAFMLTHHAAKDPVLARAELGGRDFIFDVQGHFVDPGGQWLKDAPQRGQGFLGFPGATRAGVAKIEHLGAAAVRQGRVPRFRHRLHGAVVRAEHVRGRAADDQ